MAKKHVMVKKGDGSLHNLPEEAAKKLIKAKEATEYMTQMVEGPEKKKAKPSD